MAELGVREQSVSRWRSRFVERRLDGHPIEVLLLHRHMSHDHVIAGIAAALRDVPLTSGAVALEARLAAERETPAETGPHTALGYIASPVADPRHGDRRTGHAHLHDRDGR